MKNESKNTTQVKHGSLKPYVVGFILSLIVTFVSYFLVEYQLVSGKLLVTSLVTLALLQLIIQLLCFLHLGQEDKPRWHFIFFMATVGVILIVVLGSLWIMQHLNSNMMPKQVEDFIIQDEGVKLRNQSNK